MLVSKDPRKSPPAHLKARQDFLRVQGRGKRFTSQWVLVFVAPSPTDKVRVGYTVSRKVGNAVVRNHVRRRLREIIRLEREKLDGGFDYVLMALPRSKNAAFQALQSELICLLERIHQVLQLSSSSG